MRRITIIFTCCIIAMQAAAQMDNDAMMKKWQDYMTPGDMHKMLASSNGKWDADVTVWMAPDKPQKNKAISENKMILGGRYQVSTEKGNFGGMPFEGISTMGYDNIKKLFFATWVDNMGTGIMNMEGPYDPETKTITLKGTTMEPLRGVEMSFRETIKFVDANHQVWEMYMIDGGKEVQTMEILSKRIQAKKPVKK